MGTVSASHARQTLPAQLDRVEAGEEVAITRHGRVVAVLVHPDTLRTRGAPETWRRADRIGALLDDARGKPIEPPALTADRAEELVRGVRAGRAPR